MLCESVTTIVTCIATSVVAIIAVLTFIKGIPEYMVQSSQKRAEFFIIMRKRLKENISFKNICDLLDKERGTFAQVEYGDKRDFLGFFEELALMVKSKLININVAHYMFGYYVIRCWRNDGFWADLNRDSLYWGLFREFAKAMEEIESKKLGGKYMFKKSDYRF